MLLMTVMLTGCNADPTDTKTTVSAIQHLNVMDNVTISVSNEPITTQTEQIKLQFRNNSEQEVQYWEESFVPEKKMEDGFIVVGHYGTGHEISSVLETADEVNHKTVSIQPLESGTYRFVFEQGYGWGDSDDPVYISLTFDEGESIYESDRLETWSIFLCD